jgi:hypothetical protein
VEAQLRASIRENTAHIHAYALSSAGFSPPTQAKWRKQLSFDAVEHSRVCLDVELAYWAPVDGDLELTQLNSPLTLKSLHDLLADPANIRELVRQRFNYLFFIFYTEIDHRNDHQNSNKERHCRAD